MHFIKMKSISLVSLLFLLLAMSGLQGCKGKTMEKSNIKFSSISDVPQEKWEKLAQKKIFFGHQSVGFNIIDGLKAVMAENPNIRLNIVHTSDADKFDDALFAHTWIGQNTDPSSKIEAFDNIMRNGVGDKVDIAFMKFCYVDITSRTDIDKVFDDYKSTLSGLEESFPGINFIHVTTPLTSKPTGMDALIKIAKNVIKIIIGKPVFDYKDNMNRNRYNEKLLTGYAGKYAVYDLAKVESHFQDGRATSFSVGGDTYYSLAPDYTNDGGHLNEQGSKIAAEQLLIMLANI